MLTSNQPTQADSSLETSLELQNRAVVLAKYIRDIEGSNSSKTKKTIDELSLPTLRNTILSAFDGSIDYDIDTLIARHAELAEIQKSTPDVILSEYYSSLRDNYHDRFGTNTTEVAGALKIMEPGLISNEWIVVHQTSVLSAVLYGHLRDYPQSLKLATDSLAVIPDVVSKDVQYAKSYSYGVISYLHCSLKNLTLAISAIEDALNISTTLDESINRQGQINNLVYAFMGVRDHETALKLIEILLEMESIDSPATPGLTQLRAAQANVNLDQYDTALSFARAGIDTAQNPLILRNLRIAEIQALAGLGRLDVAVPALSDLREALGEDDLNSSYVILELTRADALIAAAQGDGFTAITLMERYNDLSVQRILTSNNNSTASQLANLENDKLQRQRKEEIQRLRREALEDQLKIGMYLLSLSILALIAALVWGIFTRYRAKVATELAVAAEAALAGEKAKSQFLAVISHELRTPLNGIIGIADLLSRTAPTNDLRHKIGIINNSGHDLLKLVEQVLDMSRIDAQEMEIFPEYIDVTTVIENLDTLWRPSIEKKGVIFTSHVDTSVPNNIMADPMRLRQCVNNLLSNATKFTNDGRVHLHVTAAPVEGTRETTLSIIVADTGIGMTETVQSNLFKPFVQADSSITRQYGGSGLGLAITRSLARMMDGDLVVTSRQGAGTEFTLTLKALSVSDNDIIDTMDETFKDIDGSPKALALETTVKNDATIDTVDLPLPAIAATGPYTVEPEYQGQLDAGLDEILGLFPQPAVARETGSPTGLNDDTRDIAIDAPTATHSPDVPATPKSVPLTASEASMDDLRNLRVLIVEDVASNTDVMRIFLEPQGCLVMAAENGKEALDALSQQVFDIILMDIRMPEMDGIQAMKIIRARGGPNASVPIIALTADATAENNAECMAAGADIFLTKPLIATELYDAMRFTRRQALRRAIRAGKVGPAGDIKLQRDRRAG